MSPGAFQAAMAAGILAAQGVQSADPKQEDSRGCQPSGTTQHSAASAVQEVPVFSIVRTDVGLQDNPPTPSSVASNSAMSMPAARPGPSASFNSADASSRCQAASETPVSKQTGAVGIVTGQEAADQAAVGAAEDPASPSAAMSTNVMADGVHAELHLVTAPSVTDEADSRKLAELSHASLKHAQAQLPEPAASAPLREAAHSETPSTKPVDSKPASTQMAEIAEVSGPAAGSELSVKPAGAADDAESASPLPAGQPSERAVSCQASAATSVGAAGSKSLFSAVSKRPAEVRNQTNSASAEANTYSIHFLP